MYMYIFIYVSNYVPTNMHMYKTTYIAAAAAAHSTAARAEGAPLVHVLARSKDSCGQRLTSLLVSPDKLSDSVATLP